MMGSMCSPAAVDDLFGSVSALGGGLGGLDTDGLAERLVALERLQRRAEAAIVAVLDEADQRGSFKADGHASVRGWAKATVRWSDVEVRDRVRTVRLCRDAPEGAAELAAGRIGVAQVRELARSRANPRVGSSIVEVIGLLVEHAENLPYGEFRICVQRWESLADVDGTHRDHESAHAGRRAGDGRRHVPSRRPRRVLDGAAMLEILRRFEQAQFDAEWAELKERFGDDTCPGLLERTAGQRRFVALKAIFERAASAPPGSRVPRVTTGSPVRPSVRVFRAGLPRTKHSNGRRHSDQEGRIQRRPAGSSALECHSGSRCWDRWRSPTVRTARARSSGSPATWAERATTTAPRPCAAAPSRWRRRWALHCDQRRKPIARPRAHTCNPKVRGAGGREMPPAGAVRGATTSAHLVDSAGNRNGIPDDPPRLRRVAPELRDLHIRANCLHRAMIGLWLASRRWCN
jgi:hypothetical protein